MKSRKKNSRRRSSTGGAGATASLTPDTSTRSSDPSPDYWLFKPHPKDQEGKDEHPFVIGMDLAMPGLTGLYKAMFGTAVHGTAGPYVHTIFPSVAMPDAGAGMTFTIEWDTGGVIRILNDPVEDATVLETPKGHYETHHDGRGNYHQWFYLDEPLVEYNDFFPGGGDRHHSSRRSGGMGGMPRRPLVVATTPCFAGAITPAPSRSGLTTMLKTVHKPP